MSSSSQPVGVSVVAILLLIGALFNLISIVLLYSSPEIWDFIDQSTHSVPALIFLVLVNAGLSLACGIGMLKGRNWARLLYFGFMPVLIMLAVLNGFRITMLIGIATYIIFVIVLTRRDAVEYFTGEST